MVGTGVRKEGVSTELSLSPIRRRNQERKRQEEKTERSARARGGAAAAVGARHAGRISLGGGDSRRQALLWDDDDSEGEAEEEEEEVKERAGSQHFKSAVNRHPKEEMMGSGGTGVGEYSSGEDERVFDYHDVTVMDEGEEEEEMEEGLLVEECVVREEEPPAAPRRGRSGRKATSSSASYFKLSSNTATARKNRTEGAAANAAAAPASACPIPSAAASPPAASHFRPPSLYLSTLSSSLPNQALFTSTKTTTPHALPIATTASKRGKASIVKHNTLTTDESSGNGSGRQYRESHVGGEVVAVEDEEGRKTGLQIPSKKVWNRLSRSICARRPYNDSQDDVFAAGGRSSSMGGRSSKSSSTGSRLSLDELLTSLGLKEEESG